MAGVRITVDDREVSTALGRLEQAGQNLREPLDVVGRIVADSTRRRFETGRGPGGRGWQPSYRALEQGGRTLADTGRLRDSITHVVEGDSVLVGTNVVYGAVHQFGATIEARSAPYLRFKIAGRWARRKRVTLPARPFLGFDDDDRRDVLAVLEDYLQGLVA